MHNESVIQMGRMFREGWPFPHIAFSIQSGLIRDLFPGMEYLAEETLKEWPNVEQIADSKFDNANEKKFAANKWEKLTESAKELIEMLNGPDFLQFLTTVTGVEHLIPDPGLVGGGYHEIPVGGKLGMHIDFARHSETQFYRRVNVLLYLNKGWREEWEGDLILRNPETGAEKKISPKFGTMAIFTTTATSWHGHPVPLACPPGRSRKSLALYYYTAEPGGSMGNADTVFL